MKASNNLILIQKHYESLHDANLFEIGLQPKMDPKGIWTEGYGRAMRRNGKFLMGKENEKYANDNRTIKTEQEAITALIEDNKLREDYVNEMIGKYKFPCDQNMFDALVDIVYNCGADALESKGRPQTITRALMINNLDSVGLAFKLWVNGNGKVLPGLVARRLTEIHLFKTGEVKWFN
jgi:lysozyme